MVVDDAWRPANKSSANKSSKTSTRSCDCAFQAAEMRPLNAKLQSRDRILFFKSFQRPQIFENNFQLCAAHHALAGQDQAYGGDWFDQPLQTIPARLRNFTQLLRRIEDKIGNHQWEIAITQEQVGRFDRLKYFVATHPKQMTQTRVAQWLRIKRIAAIDQREDITIAMCGVEERVNERGTSRAYLRADQFRDGAFGQPATDRLIEKG